MHLLSVLTLSFLCAAIFASQALLKLHCVSLSTSGSPTCTTLDAFTAATTDSRSLLKHLSHKQFIKAASTTGNRIFPRANGSNSIVIIRTRHLAIHMFRRNTVNAQEAFDAITDMYQSVEHEAADSFVPSGPVLGMMPGNIGSKFRADYHGPQDTMTFIMQTALVKFTYGDLQSVLGYILEMLPGVMDQDVPDFRGDIYDVTTARLIGWVQLYVD